MSKTSLSVPDDGPTRPTYEQGIAVLRSHKDKSTVVVRLLTNEFSTELEDLPSLYVAVLNNTEEAIDFSTESISAFSEGKPVKVFSAGDLEKMIKRQAALMAFATAMSAASQSMAASMPQTTNYSGSVNAYGSGGYARANYTGYSTTYNPAATADAQARINATSAKQMELIAGARDARLSGLGGILRRNTVGAGEIAAGVVKLKPQEIRKGKALRIHVKVGQDAHEFLLRVGK